MSPVPGGVGGVLQGVPLWWGLDVLGVEREKTEN